MLPRSIPPLPGSISIIARTSVPHTYLHHPKDDTHLDSSSSSSLTDDTVPHRMRILIRTHQAGREHKPAVYPSPLSPLTSRGNHHHSSRSQALSDQASLTSAKCRPQPETGVVRIVIVRVTVVPHIERIVRVVPVSRTQPRARSTISQGV